MWSIEQLRVFAVLGVLILHSLQTAARATQADPSAVVRPYLAGLDIFFVISGFLVWRITRRRRATPALFLAHRVTRLWPLYAAATLLVCALQPLLQPYFFLDAHSVTPGHVIRSLLLVPYQNGDGTVHPVLLVGWTLEYDMLFFAVFAPVLAVPARWRLAAVTVLFLALPAARLAVPNDPVLRAIAHPRALGFLAGIWVAHAYERGWTLGPRVATAAAFACGLAYAGLTVARLDIYGATSALWMGLAVLAVWSLTSVEASGSVPFPLPFAGSLASWSYAIYLFQVIAIPLACRYAQGGFAGKFALSILASVAAGAAAHHGLEAPLNRWLRGFERREGLPAASRLVMGP